MLLNRRVAFTLVMLAILVAMVGMAAQYPPDARFMPWVVGIPAIALCLLQLGRDLRAARHAAGEAQEGEGSTLRREAAMGGYFLGLVGGILLFGFLLAVPVFILVFLRHWARASWPLALGLVAAAAVVYYLVFVQGLNVALHQGFVTQYVLERSSE
jgi:uncharacterized membrane protein YfcA